MFKLANGKKIDEERVIMAMEDSDLSHIHFLNTETGKVKNASGTNHLIKIPKISKQQIYIWMKEYTDEFIKIGDPDLAKKVYPILNRKNVLEKFEETLEKESDDGEIHGWVQSKHNYLYEAMLDWFDKLQIGITEEWDYDDDCTICQEMKKAYAENRSLTEAELKKAFAKTKRKGAITGGQLEDDPKAIVN